MKHMTILKSTLIFLGLIFLSACANQQENYAQDYSVAKKNFSEKHYQVAFNKVQKPALAGEPDAQYALGYMYYNGLGTTTNLQKAKYWFQKAATQGQPAAKQALNEIKSHN